MRLRHSIVARALFGILFGVCVLAAGQARAGGGVHYSFGAHHGFGGHHGHHGFHHFGFGQYHGYHPYWPRHHSYHYRPYRPFRGYVYRWDEPRPYLEPSGPRGPVQVPGPGAPVEGRLGPPPGAGQSFDRSYCREFTGTVVIDGQEQSLFGTACRQPDGHWRIVQD